MRGRLALVPASIAAVAALVSGLIWYGSADLVSDSGPHHRASRLVPPDGARQVTTSSDGVTVTESSLITGPSMVLSTPSQVADALAKAYQGDIVHARIWRTITTRYAASDELQTVTVRAVTDRGIEQLGTYGYLGLAFSPALLEVPGDVHDGSTWSGMGTARPDGSIHYSSTWSAKDAAPGCLRITGTTAFTDDKGVELASTPSDETWCDGKGDGGSDPVATPAFTGNVRSTPPATPDVRSWTPRQLPVVATDAFFGTGPFLARSDIAPVRLASGDLVVPNANGNDLTGLRSRATGPEMRWQAHPGGTITALGAVGDVAVVGTTTRQVAAYGPDGTWLWSHRVGDVPATRPLDLGNGTVAVTSLDGDVTVLRVATGEEVWSSSMPAEIRLDPVTDGTHLVVSSQDHTLRAFDVVTGRIGWDTRDDLVESMGIQAGMLVTRAGEGVHGISVADGNEAWSTPVDSSGLGVLAAGPVTVVATSEQTLGVDPASGRVLWRRGGSTSDISIGDLVIQHVGTTLQALDSSGSVIRTWVPTGVVSGQQWFLVPTSSGLWVVDGSGNVVGLGG